jgi:hypothetical protein
VVLSAVVAAVAYRGTSWPEQSVTALEKTTDDLALALEYGVKDIFVPLSQRVKAEACLNEAQASLQLGWLNPLERPTPRQVLHSYLARLGVPPGQESSFDLRCRYDRVESTQRCPLKHPAANIPTEQRIERSGQQFTGEDSWALIPRLKGRWRWPPR